MFRKVGDSVKNKSYIIMVLAISIVAVVILFKYLKVHKDDCCSCCPDNAEYCLDTCCKCKGFLKVEEE